MKRNVFLLAAFILLISGIAESQTYLKVLDPHFNTNFKQPGSIQEFVIAVKPRGLYIEYEMYITFNSKGSQWTKNLDTLEVEYFFDLPDNAFMIDSWLWYNNQILRARLIDIWTASQIYENIVHRVRRDPSIIYKRSAKQYEMRIFPMVGDSYRKVKVSYMAPATWSVNSVIGQLPLNLINASASVPGKVRIITYPNADFVNPRINESSNYFFVEGEDKEFGHYYYVDLLPSNKFGNLSIGFDSPAKKGAYVNYGFHNNEAIYQMAFFPSAALDFHEGRKILFLVDHNQSNSTMSSTDTEGYIENMILNNLTELDSFNVMFSGFEPKALSNSWISGKRDTVLAAMERLNAADLKNYSNLPSLMSGGVDFINNNGKSGNIMLISCSVSFGDNAAANEFIGEILNRMKKKYPIYVADYAMGYLQKYVINNLTYYGNEYFYTNLCRLTGGTLTKAYGTGLTLAQVLQNCYNTLLPAVTNMDFQVSLVGGLTYGKFNVGTTGTGYNYNLPIMQVGKSVGEFPMTINMAGFIQDKVFTKSIVLNSQDISFNDYKNNQIWNAHLMKTLESKQTKTNQDMLDIIDLSKANRVLSYYTAFLALETDVYDSTNTSTDPDDGDDGDGDVNPVDETIIVYDNESVLHISPNPFTNGTEISVSLPDRANANIVSIEIFDMLGRKVKSFDVFGITSARDFRLKWTGDDDSGSPVNQGTYVLIVSTATRKYSVKMIKV